MKKPGRRDEQPLLHSVEEATALLRRCPARAWFWWFAGTSPFVFCSLHFWSDMSRAADAASHLAESALYLALSYGFMKIAHAVFGDHLLRTLRGEEDPAPLPFRGKIRLVTSQLLIHCTTLWVLVLAAAAMLPLGWAYAFYHNAGILALSTFREGGRTRDLYRRALTQCYYRPGQNHGIMTVLTVFSVLVWMNILSGSATFIVLMKSITGEDNAFTRNPWLLLSAGFIAATMSVSYFIAGPFVKACYAVRCFHGLSRKTGEDIVVRFRAATAPAALTALVAGLMLCGLPAQGNAAEQAVARPEARSLTIDPGSLDREIRDVLQQDAFQWRMPRDGNAPKEEDKGWLASFMRDIGQWIKSIKNDIGDFLDNQLKEKIKNWLRKLLGDRHSMQGGDSGTPWADTIQLVLYVLLIVLAAVLAVLLYRQWKKRPPKAMAKPSAAPQIDLKSEEVMATQLAENEWLKLAQEKIDAGEYRLALRALFLATLAHLGEKRLIAVARSKSNGDYVRELSFRARDRGSLRGWFREQTSEFDRAWYGWHDVTRELLEQFRENHQRIVADGPR